MVISDILAGREIVMRQVRSIEVPCQGESHISHVLSAGRSSRPMGWRREGADRLSQIRIYWKNDRDMLKLVQIQKEKKEEEIQAEEKYLSAGKRLV